MSVGGNVPSSGTGRRSSNARATALTGTPVAAGRIDLSWTGSTDTVGVAGYNVYRDGTKINTAPIGSTSYSDTGLAAGANHTYKVSALDAAGNESAQSTTYTGAAASGAVTTTYTNDPENRLTQLQTGSTVLGTYAYDGAGDRISKTVGATTAYTLDLASSLPQVLSETTGSTTSAYAYGAGPLEIDQGGTTYWYLTDTLGSVRLLTDSTGATPATYAYSAFGSTRTSTGSITNEVRFTGERTDTESGLEFLRARTYDPATGTFLQRDTWGIAPTNSQSIDAYLYTANDPANAVDPSGHCSLMIGTDCVAGQGSSTYRPPSSLGPTIAKSGPGAYAPAVADQVGDVARAQFAKAQQTGPTTQRPSWISDKALSNTQNEDLANQLFAQCYKGDKSACVAMKDVHVDTGDPVGRAIDAFVHTPNWAKVVIFDAACAMATLGACLAIVPFQVVGVAQAYASKAFGNLLNGRGPTEGWSLEDAENGAIQGTAGFGAVGAASKISGPLQEPAKQILHFLFGW